MGLIRPDKADLPGTLVLGFLAEMGVVILLFEIGLETDLAQLLCAGSCARRRWPLSALCCLSPADTWCATGSVKAKRNASWPARR